VISTDQKSLSNQRNASFSIDSSTNKNSVEHFEEKYNSKKSFNPDKCIKNSFNRSTGNLVSKFLSMPDKGLLVSADQKSLSNQRNLSFSIDSSTNKKSGEHNQEKYNLNAKPGNHNSDRWKTFTGVDFASHPELLRKTNKDTGIHFAPPNLIRNKKKIILSSSTSLSQQYVKETKNLSVRPTLSFAVKQGNTMSHLNTDMKSRFRSMPKDLIDSKNKKSVESIHKKYNLNIQAGSNSDSGEWEHLIKLRNGSKLNNNLHELRNSRKINR